MLSLYLCITFIKGLWFFNSNDFFDFIIKTFLTILLLFFTYLGIMIEIKYILIELLILLIIFILYFIYKKLEVS